MTKAEIIKKISESTGVPKPDVAVTVEAFMEEIKKSMNIITNLIIHNVLIKALKVLREQKYSTVLI